MTPEALIDCARAAVRRARIRLQAADLDDIVQHACVVGLRALARHDPTRGAAEATWVGLAVAGAVADRFRTLTRYRSPHRHRRLEPLPEPHTASFAALAVEPDVGAELCRAEARDVLLAAVRRLPHSERRAVRAQLRGVPFEDAATREGVSPQIVGRRAKHGRERLARSSRLAAV